MKCEEGIHYFFSHKGFCQCGERTTEVYDAGYKQGRKDAIDEVLVLIKSVEATLICEAEWSEWLQKKLQEKIT